MCGGLRRLCCWMAVVAGFWLTIGGVQAAQTEQAEQESEEVIHAFTSQEEPVSEIVEISEKKKHLIMFAMGFALLIFVIVTAGLGISMVLFGKQVFVAHMVFAGFTVFLSIAHAVVAVVWFFPF